MVCIGGANEIGRFDAKLLDEILELGGVFGNILFDWEVKIFSFVENFVAVFVGAGLKTDDSSLFFLVFLLNL